MSLISFQKHSGFHISPSKFHLSRFQIYSVNKFGFGQKYPRFHMCPYKFIDCALKFIPKIS